MILHSETGVVIDTIGYGLALINWEAVVAELRKRRLSDEVLGDFVEAVKQEVGELPAWCKALFYVGAGRCPAPESFFLHEELLPGYSLENLLACVDRQEVFFGALANHYFSGLSGSMVSRLTERDLAAWYQVCGEQEIPDDITVELLYICGNFETVKRELHLLFAKIYRVVKAMHVAAAPQIEETVQILNDPAGQKELERRMNYKLSGKGIQEPDVAVSLWQAYALFPMDPERKVANLILCGMRYRDSADAPSSLSGIDFMSFVAACGSENKIRIVYLLLEHGKLTSSQLSKMLHSSPPMTGRYLDSLKGDGVIRVKGQEGKNIFYELNADYFRSVKKTADVFWANFR